MKSPAFFAGICVLTAAAAIAVPLALNEPTVVNTRVAYVDGSRVTIIDDGVNPREVRIERSGRSRFSGQLRADGRWTNVSNCRSTPTTGCLRPPSESELDRIALRSEAEAALSRALHELQNRG